MTLTVVSSESIEKNHCSYVRVKRTMDMESSLRLTTLVISYTSSEQTIPTAMLMDSSKLAPCLSIGYSSTIPSNNRAISACSPGMTLSSQKMGT